MLSRSSVFQGEILATINSCIKNVLILAVKKGDCDQQRNATAILGVGVCGCGNGPGWGRGVQAGEREVLSRDDVEEVLPALLSAPRQGLPTLLLE